MKHTKNIPIVLLFLLVHFITGCKENSSEASIDDTPFWQQTNGPNGGTIQDISVSSKGTIFVSTASGVFRSDDLTAWTLKNSGFSSSVLAADSSGNVYASSSADVLRSNDNGEHWSSFGTGITGNVRAIAVSSQGHIFAGSSDGIFRSLGNTGAWSNVSGTIIASQILSIAVAGNGYIFAGTNGSIFRSTDDGMNWSASVSGLDAGEVEHIISASDGILYAAVYNSSLTGGIYRSDNNGDSWTKLDLGLNLPHVTSMISRSVNIFAGIEYFSSTSTQNLFRSTDGGASWGKLTSGFGSNWITSLAEDKQGHILAGTSGSGMYFSANNGDQFQQTNSGLTVPNVYALAFASGTTLYAGTDGGVSRSTDNGASWSQVLAGDGRMDVTAVAVDSTGSVYAGTRGYGLYKSQDGISWFPSWNPSLTGFAGGAITTIAAHPSGALLLNIIGYGGPYRSVNGGTNFSKVDGNGGSGAKFYIDSTGAIYFIYGSVDVSSDAGASWQTLTGFTGKQISSLARVGSYLIAGGTNGIYRSGDNGKTSESFAAPGGGVSIIVANENGVLFAASYNSGIFRSSDQGASWTRINGGLTNTSIESLVLSPSGFLFIGTAGSGVFRSITAP